MIWGACAPWPQRRTATALGHKNYKSTVGQNKVEHFILISYVINITHICKANVTVRQ